MTVPQPQWLQNNGFTTVKDLPAGVTLATVIAKVMNRTKNYSLDSYRFHLENAIDGLRQNRIYNANNVEVMYAVPNQAGIIELPSYAITWVKVGIAIQGQLFNIAVNNNMLLNRATTCGDDIRQVFAGGLGAYAPFDGYFFAPHFVGDSLVTGLFGLGGGWLSPCFRYDKQTKRLQFDGPILTNQVDNEIVIEFTSTGIKEGTIIEPELIEPLIRWCRWLDAESDVSSHVNNALAERRKSQYDESVREMRKYRNKFTVSEFLDTMYKKYKALPYRTW